MNDVVTLVLGIDAKTIEQLKVSWPTWRRNRAEMWDWPWVIAYDRDQLTQEQVVELVDGEMGKRGEVTLVPWPFPGCPAYETQREKMLSGHVFVPAAWVKTPWHMKLDTDALARPHPRWYDPAWFTVPDAYVAPRWGYTKGIDFLGRLDRWASYDNAGVVWKNPPPVTGFDPQAMRVGHARMCSWCSYYRTTFTQTVSNLCTILGQQYKLPVPSQDTVAWYVCERLGRFKRIENMKARGWSNHPKIDDLRRVAAEIMGQAAAA